MILDKVRGIVDLVKNYKHIKGVLTGAGALSAALITGATVHNSIRIQKLKDNSLDLTVSTRLQNDVNDLSKVVNSTVDAVEEVSTKVDEQIDKIDTMLSLSHRLSKEVDRNQIAIKMTCDTSGKFDRGRKEEILALLAKDLDK